MHADQAELDGPADFDETFREHYWPMVRSLSVACGDREAAADAVQDAFTVGGSITVAVNGGALSLVSSSPAPGFGAEVHDNGPSRVEVRFTNGDTEWRIRIELGDGSLTQEITQHG